MEEDIKKIELCVRKYLCLRKILRAFVIIGFVVLLYFKLTDNVGNLEFACYLFAIFTIPGSILAIMWSNLKLDINNEILVAENEMEIHECSVLEEKGDKEEKADTDLLNALKLKIDGTKHGIETLESIKRLVIF